MVSLSCHTLNDVALLPPVKHLNDKVCLQGMIVACLLGEAEIY